MPRTASPQSDITVDVDGLGSFMFARRQQRDVFRIRGEYDKLTGGNYTEEGSYGDLPALARATIDVLLVSAPSSFTAIQADPLLDDNWQVDLVKVFTALREKELSFRPVSREGSAPAGA